MFPIPLTLLSMVYTGGVTTGTGWRSFLFDVHFVDLENFQPLARFKVQKFAEVTKFVLGFKCDSSAPQTAGGECFYRLNK